VGELGVMLADANGWPELLPFVFECAASGREPLMTSALAVLSDLAAYATDALRPGLAQVHALLGACLGHASLEVALGALSAVANLIQALDEAAERGAFQDLVGPMLSTLGRALTAGDTASAQEALEVLIEVAESDPRFLRKQLDQVVGAMLSVAGADELEDSVRTLAAEFLVTLCEARDKAPGMMRKLPAFPAKLFEVLMVFLLDVEDAPLWHGGDSDAHEEEGHSEKFDYAQECLDRLSLSLGGTAIVPAAGQLLPAWLGDADWRKRHAALICLAQIAEGCAKVMSSQLPVLTDMCVKGLADPHPKAR